MKSSNTKFVFYLAMWTAGLVCVSSGSRLSFFLGLAVIIFSELLTFRRSQPAARITAGFVPVAMALALIPCSVVAAQDGSALFPVVPLVGFWLLGIVEEVYSWHKSRRLA